MARAPYFFCGDEEDANPYEILGLKNCNHDRKEMKRITKVLKALTHPDKNYGNEFAQQSFILATTAGDVLSDPGYKENCDSYLHFSNKCFRKTDESGNSKVLKNFFARKRELDRNKAIQKWTAIFKAQLTTLRNFPQTYSAKAGEFLAQTFKSRVGRVRKTYRNIGRWIGRIAYGGPIRRGTKAPIVPVAPAKTSDVDRPRPDDDRIITGEFPTTEQRTYPFTETRTITETEMRTETRTETQVVTVTSYGINVSDYARDIERIARNIDPRYIGAAGVFVACVAGGWYLVKRSIHRRQQAPLPLPVADEDVQMEDDNDEDEDEDDNDDNDEDDDEDNDQVAQVGDEEEGLDDQNGGRDEVGQDGEDENDGEDSEDENENDSDSDEDDGDHPDGQDREVIDVEDASDVGGDDEEEEGSVERDENTDIDDEEGPAEGDDNGDTDEGMDEVDEDEEDGTADPALPQNSGNTTNSTPVAPTSASAARYFTADTKKPTRTPRQRRQKGVATPTRRSTRINAGKRTQS